MGQLEVLWVQTLFCFALRSSCSPCFTRGNFIKAFFSLFAKAIMMMVVNLVSSSIFVADVLHVLMVCFLVGRDFAFCTLGKTWAYF
jgi:hypothetical protein